MLWGPILEPILKQQRVTDPKLKLILNGLIIAAYPLSQFFAIHPLNSLSEKIGKKKVLLFTQLGTVISLIIGVMALSIPILSQYSIYSISIGIWLIIFSRIIDGISGGNAMVTNNYANDIINTEKLDKAKSFTSIELAMICGSLSGVFLGPIFATSRFKSVGALYLILFIAFIGIHVIMNRVKDIKNNNGSKISLKQDFNIFLQLEKIKNFPVVKQTLMYRAVFQFLFMSFITSIFLFLESHLGITGSELSSVMFIVAVVTIFTVTIVIPKIIAKYGIDKAFWLSKPFLITGLLMFYIIPFRGSGNDVGAGLLLSYFVLVTGVSLALSLFKHFLTEGLDENKQSHVIALEEQVIIFSAFLGASTTGLVSALINQYGFPAQTLFLYYATLGLVYIIINSLIFKNKKI